MRLAAIGAIIVLVGLKAKAAGPDSNGESAFARHTTLSLIEPLNKDEESKARVRITSVGVILEQEKDPQQVLKLKLNRAKLLLQVSRLDRARKAQEKAAQEINFAAADLAALAEFKTLSREQASYLNYLRGIVTMDSGAYEQGLGYLATALELNSKAPYAIEVSLFLGDEYYHLHLYDKSAQEFSRPFQEMHPEDRLYRKYYLARIAAKQEHFAEAEKLYLELLQQKSVQVKRFPVLVLQELAQLEVRFKSEQQVLEFCRTVLKLKSEDEATFLREAMLTEKDLGKSAGAFSGRIVELTKDSVEKIRLGLQPVQQQRRESAKADVSFELEALIRDFRALTPADQKKVLESATLNSELRIEVERSIEVQSEKFAALVKAKKPPEELRDPGAKLLTELAFLEENFKSENRVKAMKLWLDVCASLKKLECVVERAQKILGNTEYTSLRESAARERISALEELSKQDGIRYSGQERQALADFLEDPKRKDWLNVAKRLSAIDTAAKNYAAAQPVLTAIDEREKSEESYYRLQLNRFNQGLFNEVVQDARISVPFHSPRNAELIRESHLRLAQQDAKSGGNFAEYELHIKEYLKQVHDPEKRAALLKDYYNRLEQNHDDDKLLHELTAVSQATRFSKDTEPLTRRLINRLFGNGRYAEVQSLLGSNAEALAEDLRFTSILARLAARESVSRAELNRLTEANRIYVLGIYALAATPRVGEYLRSTSHPPRAIADLGTLAGKIERCDSTSGQGEEKPTELERKIERVTFAHSKKLSDAATTAMMKSLEKVRALRRQILPALSKLTPPVQERVLVKAAALEKSAADAITSAPLPAGLSQTQTVEYQAQVQAMAKEFLTQGQQFEQARSKIAQQITDKAEASRVPVHKLLDAEKWPWPTTPVLQDLKIRDAQEKLMTALIDLDFMRTSNSLSAADYWAMRSGFLLSKAPCQAMVEYVYQELQANRQNSLIEHWSRM